jgi:serine/threonine-protein kinase
MANPTESLPDRVTEVSRATTGVSLGLLLFIAFVGLIIIAQGAAIGLTMMRGNAVADREVEIALQQGQSVQQALERERFRQLELISGLFAADPYFASYVAEAQQSALDFGGNVDTASVTDLLHERQRDIGFDFSMVLDDRGDVIARTDGRVQEALSLVDDPVAGPVIETLEAATGYWQRAGNVYQVSVVPLANGYELAGFLVTGMLVGADVAHEIALTSGAEILILSEDGQDGWRAAATTLDEASVSALLGQLPESLDAAFQADLMVAGHAWRPAVRQLGNSGAVAITLTDHAAALASYRSIQNVLWLSMLAALLVAVIIGAVMARSISGPIRQLAEAAGFAAEGDYHHELPQPRHAGSELRRLSSAFRRLLADLREKSEMERFLAELARLQPDQGENLPAASTPQDAASETGFLLGINWQLPGSTASDGDLLGQTEQVLDAAVRVIAPLRGRLLGSGGASAVMHLPAIDPASVICAAGDIISRLNGMTQMSAAVVPAEIVTGEVISAGHRVQTWQASSSSALQQLSMDARHGEIYLVKSMGEQLKSIGLPVKASSGRTTGRNFYAVDAAAAKTFMTNDDDRTMAMTEVGALPVETAGTQGLRAGMVFGNRFAILSELGRGGMGAVFKALDRELHETVALKVLLGGQSFSMEELAAMKSEIRLARRISHPNILRTHDFGIFDNTPYISMEYVRGLTLKSILKQSGRLPTSAALRIARQVCAGLVAAHEQGVLHRDIKPENIIIEPSANSKLMDFGIAQVTRDDDGQAQPMGTPRYAAPEQMLGEPLDETVDIYAFGILLFEMFTGRVPFRASSLEALISLKQNGLPGDIFDEYPDVPVAVRVLVASCLAGSRTQRPATASELSTRLAQLGA